MSSSSVIDQIGVFFGGAYVAAFKCYNTPQVAGLGAVRRGKPKDADAAQWYLGMPAGTAFGSVMVVRLSDGAEKRVAFAGPVSGGKKVSHEVVLQVFVRSTALDAEDVEDYTRTLLDALRDRLHSDRTCGSGGLDGQPTPGFEIGEDYDGPGSDLIEWHLSDVETSANLSKQYLTIHFSASEYIEA